eukprot:gene18168-21731_t
MARKVASVGDMAGITVSQTGGGAAARYCEAVAGQQDQLTESAGRVGQAEGGNRLISPGSKIIRHQAALVLGKSGRSPRGHRSCNTGSHPSPPSRRYSPAFPADSKNYILENLTENVNSSSKVGEKA